MILKSFGIQSQRLGLRMDFRPPSVLREALVFGMNREWPGQSRLFRRQRASANCEDFNESAPSACKYLNASREHSFRRNSMIMTQHTTKPCSAPDWTISTVGWI